MRSRLPIPCSSNHVVRTFVKHLSPNNPPAVSSPRCGFEQWHPSVWPSILRGRTPTSKTDGPSAQHWPPDSFRPATPTGRSATSPTKTPSSHHPRRRHLVQHRVRPNTSASSSQHLHPWEWLVGNQKRSLRLCPPDWVYPDVNRTTDTTMGRSGYDTTNMKLAKNPRPAASNPVQKPKEVEKKQPAQQQGQAQNSSHQQQQQQQQGESQCASLSDDFASSADGVVRVLLQVAGGQEKAMADVVSGVGGHPVYNIPQPQDQPPQGQMPIPRLDGRGWTFWL